MLLAFSLFCKRANTFVSWNIEMGKHFSCRDFPGHPKFRKQRKDYLSEFAEYEKLSTVEAPHFSHAISIA